MDQHVLQGMITRRWRSDETIVKWTKWTSLERDMCIFLESPGVMYNEVAIWPSNDLYMLVKQIEKCFDKLEVYVHWYDNNELLHEGIL